jgi:hypothetical protein
MQEAYGRVGESANGRVSEAHGLEGSRFISWQLYGLAAGGSRERFDVWQLYRLRRSRSQEMNTLGRNARRVIRGSRLLSHFAVAHALVQNAGRG